MVGTPLRAVIVVTVPLVGEPLLAIPRDDTREEIERVYTVIVLIRSEFRWLRCDREPG